MLYKEQQVFASDGRSNYRIPSLIVTNKGTLLAFCNDRKGTLADHAATTTLVFARKGLGESWSEVSELAGFSGWAFSIGSAVYDEECEKAILISRRTIVTKSEFESKDPSAEKEARQKEKECFEKFGICRGAFLLVSTDDGKSFVEEEMNLQPFEGMHWDGSHPTVPAFTHGSAHGIQLRHGKHKGRLLCPSRTRTGDYTDWDGLRQCVHNNAVYSDDHGKTWRTADCVQVATGEGTLIERADGSILYNSRAYLQDGKRYLATSFDGGATYSDFRTDGFLREEKNFGCNASFIRVELEDIKDTSILPEGARDVTVFCNPRSDLRENLTACVSFDSGDTWQITRQIFKGPSSYSSLVFNPVDQHFYLMYEKGDPNETDWNIAPVVKGICIAEFDLEWLLGQDASQEPLTTL